jgi:hypothetical protein
MQFPKEFLKSVVFIGYVDNSGKTILTGTGFIVSKQNGVFRHTYFVTAYHNILRAEQKNLDSFVLRLNLKNGSAEYEQYPLSEFVFHPDHADGLECIDVAVSHMGFDESVDFASFNISTFADEQIMETEQIGLGDEIAIIGLFTKHSGNTRNEPIVRVGNICAMPIDKVKTEIGNMSAYLIEARSIGGLSGSPVFAYMSHTRAKIINLTPTDVKLDWRPRVEGQPVFYCIGLIHGHYDTGVAMDTLIENVSGAANNINVGVAVVVPAIKILETLNQPRLIEMENEREEAFRRTKLPIIVIK